ncbi:MAG: hypothetical protein HY208_05665 [Nitrospirae bacterium]|nr:hypothetical protein [Nitrospirota bacterium]
MKELGFLYFLSTEREDRLRVEAVKEHGAITSFTVQYEALLRGDWQPIVRYDTAHGFAHKDLLHPDGTGEKQPLYLPDYNMAFTYAIQDLKAAWRWYRMGYEEEMPI